MTHSQKSASNSLESRSAADHSSDPSRLNSLAFDHARRTSLAWIKKKKKKRSKFRLFCIEYTCSRHAGKAEGGDRELEKRQKRENTQLPPCPEMLGTFWIFIGMPARSLHFRTQRYLLLPSMLLQGNMAMRTNQNQNMVK